MLSRALTSRRPTRALPWAANSPAGGQPPARSGAPLPRASYLKTKHRSFEPSGLLPLSLTAAESSGPHKAFARELWAAGVRTQTAVQLCCRGHTYSNPPPRAPKRHSTHATKTDPSYSCHSRQRQPMAREKVQRKRGQPWNAQLINHPHCDLFREKRGAAPRHGKHGGNHRTDCRSGRGQRSVRICSTS